jgi:hypothetical protein
MNGMPINAHSIPMATMVRWSAILQSSQCVDVSISLSGLFNQICGLVEISVLVEVQELEKRQRVETAIGKLRLDLPDPDLVRAGWKARQEKSFIPFIHSV